MRVPFFAFLFVLIGSAAFAQQVVPDPKTDNFIERKIETIAENSSEDIDFTTIFDALNYYRDHPLELNTATAEELLTAYVVEQKQARTSRQQQADQTVAGWNALHADVGSFADEHSTL